MINSYWTLNGSYFEEYKSLPQESIERLTYKGEINGIKIFTSDKIPQGTLRYYEGDICKAEIIGIKND
jgi:hypothetical protein